jgi:hypothetical protein
MSAAERMDSGWTKSSPHCAGKSPVRTERRLQDRSACRVPRVSLPTMNQARDDAKIGHAASVRGDVGRRGHPVGRWVRESAVRPAGYVRP